MRSDIRTGADLDAYLSDTQRSQDAEQRECRVGYWTTTLTGGRWWAHDPRPEDVRVGDLAALAQVLRFGGHTTHQEPGWRRGRLAPYSVAQHSCLVYELVCGWVAWNANDLTEVKTAARAALLHDGHEVYPPGDQLSPVLRYDCPASAAIRAMSRNAADAFRVAVGIPLVMPEIVKRADLVLLATEKRDLMPADGEVWGNNGRELPAPLDRRIEVWDAEHARDAFFRRLRACAPDLCEGL